MKILQSSRSKSSTPPILLPIALMVAIATLAGCERADRTSDSTDSQPAAGQPAAGQPAAGQPAAGERVVDQGVGDEQPLGKVAEFDGFTLRANVSPTEFLPAAMAQQYGIEAGPGRSMLNLVILEKQTDGEPVTVSAEVSAHYESLIGHPTAVDMRKVEADGRVSYIGTLDTSGQEIFRFVIEAQPQGIEQPLQMNFEVQLPTLDAD